MTCSGILALWGPPGCSGVGNRPGLPQERGTASRAAGEVIVFPAPPGERASEDYIVEAGGKAVFVYSAPVVRDGPASFASFDFSGTVTVTVVADRKVDSVCIRPMSCGIQPAISGNRISFPLARPANLTLELNSSTERPLHLFANPVEADTPDPADKDVIYFGPGVHEVATLRPRSGQTVYLAGGAIVRAVLPPDEKPAQEVNGRGNRVYAPFLETRGARGVKICGRGLLDLGALPWHARTAMWFEDSQEILVEGILVRDAPAWGIAMSGSKHVTVRNVKQICARENGDGIDICNSQDVLVEECFLRNNDDAVCVKTPSPPPAMESRDIAVRRCVIWNDRAHGLGVTSETRANISHVCFADSDTIHDFSGGSGGALAVLVSDAGTVSEIRFRDIRVEESTNTLINCWIGADRWGRDKERGHIRDLTFENVACAGTNAPAIRVRGCDPGHLIEGVRFEQLQIQGAIIRELALANLRTNAFVTGLGVVSGPAKP